MEPEVLREAELLAQSLSTALSCGDAEEAKRRAQQLAQLALPISVSLCRPTLPRDNIRLKVGIEDAVSKLNAPIVMHVTTDMTISELKEKVNKEFGFHPSLQTWVIGKRLAQDTETLYSHAIKNDDDQVFLYITSAQKAGLTREQQLLDEKNQRLDEILQKVTLEPRGTADLGVKKTEVKQERKPAQPEKLPVGWSCPQCTYLNKPTRPGCEICSFERPPDYKVPDVYKPDEDEVRRLQKEEVACMQYMQAQVEERQRNYESLLETDSRNLIGNVQLVDCPICFTAVEPGVGVTLRECLHNFCKDCLKETITHSTDAEVPCPYRDDTYACDGRLLDREIQALLSPEEHKKFLELRLSIAENRSDNSYHCKTPDCAGWCIFEDEVNEFECPLCKETNCLLCKAIHKNMNCKEYQDDLRIRAENDVAAKQTADMLNTLVQSGEAMHCPKCQVIVQKKDGCDWICCLMCKTELCWVTRQARWGPKGSGDTSGGCRCRVNGVICHPQCQNCH